MNVWPNAKGKRKTGPGQRAFGRTPLSSVVVVVGNTDGRGGEKV